MPLFPPHGPIDRVAAEAGLAEGWGAALGDVIKSSTNTTFCATGPAGERYAVRVTPDASDAVLTRQHDETAFVNWLAREGELAGSVCNPIPAKGGSLVRAADGLSISVWRWASGSPVEWATFTWLSDPAFVRAWGRWLGRMHEASRAFEAAFPGIAARVQRYDDVHDGTLRGAHVDAADAAVEGNPSHWGILHGDANISNFHWDAPTDSIDVFDFDQAQRGWWLADLAQAAIFAHMLAEAGAPVSGAPVPQADPVAFETWLVEGYESVAGAGAVDRARLDRMVAMRRVFYDRFASRALEEGVPPEIAPAMVPFLEYTLRWTREESRAQPKKPNSGLLAPGADAVVIQDQIGDAP